MSIDHQFWRRVSAFLSGNLRADEAADIEALSKQGSGDDADAFRESEKIWNHAGMKLRVADTDTDREWLKLRRRIEKGGSGGRVVNLLSEHSIWLKIAAGILLIAGAFYIFWPSPADIVIKAGEHVATVYLPDSSKVWLNVGSTLAYDEDYGQNRRNTRISGEGYFVVKPDSVSPFTVDTELASVRVLGTEFNVREDSAGVVLTVAHGTVSFKSSEHPEKVEVHAREKAVITGKEAPVKSDNDDPHFATWREKNNPAYEHERDNPGTYLVNSFSWKKNKLNMSVVDGTIKNNAGLAAYHNIELKVTYTKPNRKTSTSHFTITDTVRSGEALPYQKTLLDIFTDTQDVKVEIVSAEAVSVLE